MELNALYSLGIMEWLAKDEKAILRALLVAYLVFLSDDERAKNPQFQNDHYGDWTHPKIAEVRCYSECSMLMTGRRPNPNQGI
jgi:hypothetical protein